MYDSFLSCSERKLGYSTRISAQQVIGSEENHIHDASTRIYKSIKTSSDFRDQRTYPRSWRQVLAPTKTEIAPNHEFKGQGLVKQTVCVSNNISRSH